MFKYTTDKTRRHKMETEWDTGYFIGINSRTTEYLIAKGSGIFSTTTIRRHQDDKAYDPEIVKEVTILHRDYVMDGAKSTPVGVRQHTAATSTPNPEATPIMPRRMKLRQEDFIDHGYTIGCPGCESIQLESNVRRGHNEECRSRMEKELSKSDRAVRAKDRIDEKVAQMGEQAMQGQEEIDPDATELVDGPESPGRMPATLLRMAGEPKLLENRRRERTLVQALKISGVRRLRGDATWTNLEQTSEVNTESPQGNPRLRSEGSRRRIEQAWTKP